jgi:isopentenyl diphosphate isomerase/L-lactate dehydrogenase-like FMN-dependent dehydrogenase
LRHPAPPEDAELADALDRIGSPPVTTLAEIIANATAEFADVLRDRKNSRKIPHRFEACGYVPFRNSDAKDGLWKIGERRQAVYAKAELSSNEQRVAVQNKYGQ